MAPPKAGFGKREDKPLPPWMRPDADNPPAQRGRWSLSRDRDPPRADKAKAPPPAQKPSSSRPASMPVRPLAVEPADLGPDEHVSPRPAPKAAPVKPPKPAQSKPAAKPPQAARTRLPAPRRAPRPPAKVLPPPQPEPELAPEPPVLMQPEPELEPQAQYSAVEYDKVPQAHADVEYADGSYKVLPNASALEQVAYAEAGSQVLGSAEAPAEQPVVRERRNPAKDIPPPEPEIPASTQPPDAVVQDEWTGGGDPPELPKKRRGVSGLFVAAMLCLLGAAVLMFPGNGNLLNGAVGAVTKMFEPPPLPPCQDGFIRAPDRKCWPIRKRAAGSIPQSSAVAAAPFSGDIMQPQPQPQQRAESRPRLRRALGRLLRPAGRRTAGLEQL